MRFDNCDGVEHLLVASKLCSCSPAEAMRDEDDGMWASCLTDLAPSGLCRDK